MSGRAGEQHETFDRLGRCARRQPVAEGLHVAATAALPCLCRALLAGAPSVLCPPLSCRAHPLACAPAAHAQGPQAPGRSRQDLQDRRHRRHRGVHSPARCGLLYQLEARACVWVGPGRRAVAGQPCSPWARRHAGRPTPARAPAASIYMQASPAPSSRSSRNITSATWPDATNRPQRWQPLRHAARRAPRDAVWSRARWPYRCQPRRAASTRMGRAGSGGCSQTTPEILFHAFFSSCRSTAYPLR